MVHTHTHTHTHTHIYIYIIKASGMVIKLTLTTDSIIHYLLKKELDKKKHEFFSSSTMEEIDKIKEKGKK